MKIQNKSYWIKCDKRPKSSKFYCSSCHSVCMCIHYITDENNKKINVCNYQFCPNCGQEMNIGIFANTTSNN